jgi:ribosomal protein S18 acetylase RimI-like enzyme
MGTDSANSVTIRPAKKADVDVLGKYGAMLVALHHEWDADRFIPAAKSTPASYSHWLESQIKRSEIVVLVAEQAGSIIGYTYAGLEGYDYMDLRGPAAVIYDLFVDPDRRKEGTGRKLLLATIEELTKRGASQVILSTAQKNETAQRLFNSTGFRPTMIEMTLTIKSDDQPE